jgi:uncharacterized protein YcfJ
MKNFSAIVFAAAALVSLNVHAKDVMATIVNVTPFYTDRVQQTQVCDVIQGDRPQQIAAVNPGSVIGGIAGALLGSRVGGGNGRLAMTAVGAVTGAMTGDRLAQRDSQPQQSCHWVQRAEQQISGYRVTYAYEGDTAQAVLSYDPSRGGSVSTMMAQTSLSIR